MWDNPGPWTIFPNLWFIQFYFCLLKILRKGKEETHLLTHRFPISGALFFFLWTQVTSQYHFISAEHTLCGFSKDVCWHWILSVCGTCWECFYFTFFFFLFRAAPTACGGSQARGQIRATAVGLCHSHSNARSEPCLRSPP